ncbi:MAG: hypothetical protein D6754_02765 [Alphaproteobacteria bacterium]|nr:MAG: hypothetical protein D6754_02765 [Alphaproteobacteria bacterium]
MQETKLDATDLLKLAIPPGAVLAFDRKDGCPAGWSDLGKDEPDRFAGRMLIAIGPRKDRPDNQTTLERAFDAQGGEERVTLTIPQMPRHFHRVGDHHSRLASSRFNSIQE